MIEKLLDNSLIFAKHDTTISDQEIKVLKHSRKGFLFDSNDIWTKNFVNPMLDVTMESFDRYWVSLADSLAVAKNANGSKLDKLRKRIVSMFKTERLFIIIETNMMETDFLDVTLNFLVANIFLTVNQTTILLNQYTIKPP